MPRPQPPLPLEPTQPPGRAHPLPHTHVCYLVCMNTGGGEMRGVAHDRQVLLLANMQRRSNMPPRRIWRAPANMDTLASPPLPCCPDGLSMIPCGDPTTPLHRRPCCPLAAGMRPPPTSMHHLPLALLALSMNMRGVLPPCRLGLPLTRPAGCRSRTGPLISSIMYPVPAEIMRQIFIWSVRDRVKTL